MLLLNRFLLLACFLTACSNPSPSQTAVTPSSSPVSPVPGSGAFRNACANLTQNLEQNLKIANPSGKASLTATDLGVGTDAYLAKRFADADANKDQQLNANELTTYLSALPALGSICTQP